MNTARLPTGGTVSYSMGTLTTPLNSGGTKIIWSNEDKFETGTKRMRNLYKIWIVNREDDAVTECTPVIAKDDVTACIKTYVKTGADPDNTHLVLQRLGEVPEWEKE